MGIQLGMQLGMAQAGWHMTGRSQFFLPENMPPINLNGNETIPQTADKGLNPGWQSGSHEGGGQGGMQGGGHTGPQGMGLGMAMAGPAPA